MHCGRIVMPRTNPDFAWHREQMALEQAFEARYLVHHRSFLFLVRAMNINISLPFDTVINRSGRHCRSLRWHPATERLWWADSSSHTLLSWSDGESAPLKQELVDTPHVLAHGLSGHMLVGMAKRLCLIDPGVGTGRGTPHIRTLATIDAADPRIVIGGGRTDREGNFVFGTCNIAPDPRPIGSFYQFSQQYGLRRLALPTVIGAAAVCFNLAGTSMLFADEVDGTLFQCDYDAARAGIGNVRRFAPAVMAGMRIQDAVVAADDSVWSIWWGAGSSGALACHGSDGTLASIARLPPGYPAGLAIAGPRMDRLMVLSRNGSLRSFVHQAPRGVAESPFADDLYTEYGLGQQLNPRPPAQSRSLTY
jgi:L-arabinonolactonase